MITVTKPADEEALRLILAHLTMIKAYVRAIVHDHHLAQDTASDVVVAILEAWERCDHSLPFAPWARGVARRVALNALVKKKREPELVSDAMLEDLAEQIMTMGDESVLEERKEALRCCMQRLPAHYCRLLYQRYWECLSGAEISKIVGRSLSGLYVSFRRVHRMLYVCIRIQAPNL